MQKEKNILGLLPFLNETCDFIEDQNFIISERFQVRTLDKGFSIFLSKSIPEELRHLVFPNQKAVIINNLCKTYEQETRENYREKLSNISISAQTTFNLLSEINPISIPFAIILSEENLKFDYIDHFEFDMWSDAFQLRKKEYKLKNRINLQEIKGVFESSLSAIEKDPSLYITMSRFCSSLIKDNRDDKLLDMAISLESLVPGGGEYKFRFPFFLSLIAEDDIKKRKIVKDDLEILYNTRCAIAHGGSDYQKIAQKAYKNFPTFVVITKTCVLYRIQFENRLPKIKWNDHLIDLCYGENRII